MRAMPGRFWITRSGSPKVPGTVVISLWVMVCLVASSPWPGLITVVSYWPTL